MSSISPDKFVSILFTDEGPRNGWNVCQINFRPYRAKCLGAGCFGGLAYLDAEVNLFLQRFFSNFPEVDSSKIPHTEWIEQEDFLLMSKRFQMLYVEEKTWLEKFVPVKESQETMQSLTKLAEEILKKS